MEPKDNHFVKFNISGTHFVMLQSTISLPDRSDFLLKFSGASHGKRRNLADGYLEQSEEFFFQRSPDVFKVILDFYLYGILHVPPALHRPDIFDKELNFWEIPSKFINVCCNENDEISSIRECDNKNHTDPVHLDAKCYGKTEEIDKSLEDKVSHENSHCWISSRSQSTILIASVIDETEPDDLKLHPPNECNEDSKFSGTNFLSPNTDLGHSNPDDKHIDQIKAPLLSQRRNAFVDTMQLQFSYVWTHPKDLKHYKNAGGWRRRMKNFLEDPTSSQQAKVYSYVSMGFVVASIFGLLLGSMNQFQKEDGTPHLALEILEIICIVWFTLEYLIRLCIYPRKKEFMLDTMNIIDILSIVPFYLELIVYQSGITEDDTSMRNIKGLLMVIRVLRICRVARILKLARHSGSLKGFGSAMKASKEQFRLLGVYIGTVVLLFSTIVYFLEKDVPNTEFTSIPRTFWWCVVTMTTVGYGDMIPVTIGGQIVASCATIMGVIVLAFPITVIVNTFGKVQMSVNPELNQNEIEEHENPSYSTVKSVAII